MREFGFNQAQFSSGCLQSVLVCTVLGTSLFLSSCEPETRHAHSTDHIRMMNKGLINYNRQIVRSENEEIEDFISRHHWEMQRSATGLRYMIYEKGKGRSISRRDEVSLKYRINLLNGNEIYNSDSLGIKVISVGNSEGETGLQEALLLMNVGDHAKLVVPSHLAYGLLGDLKRIPAGASLVYDIEILGPVKGRVDKH